MASSRYRHLPEIAIGGGNTMLQPRRLLAIHLMIIAGFALSNLPIGIADASGHRSLFGFSRLMRLEEEANIPSAFSSLALLACAIVAFANRSRLASSDPDRSAWALLGGFFAFQALDEEAMIHEIGNEIGARAEWGGTPYAIGVFLYIPILVWMVMRLFPFWLRQERQLRVVLFFAAGIYVAGAMGFELVENQLRSLGYDNFDLPMRISFVCEECGEMLGVAFFLYAFLRRFAELGGGPLLRLVVADAGGGEAPIEQAIQPACVIEPRAHSMVISSRP
jgi:hypothetical protein